MDPKNEGLLQQWYNRKLQDTIHLPGSLQAQGYGNDITPDTQWWSGKLGGLWKESPIYEKYRQPGNVKIYEWLQPRKHYIGVAWYQRELSVPSDWKNKRVTLYLERVHWASTVWVDDKLVEKQRSLATSHDFDLTGFVRPGSHHTLTVRIDNSALVDLGKWPHSVSDETQTAWNGIVGKIELRPTPLVWVSDIQIFPDIKGKTAKVIVKIDNAVKKKGLVYLTVKAESYNTSNIWQVLPLVKKIVVSEGQTSATIEYPMGNEIQLWDEFNPALYNLTINIQGKVKGYRVNDTAVTSFGMREISTKGKYFELNGKIIAIRGNVHDAEFPYNGYPNTDLKYWRDLWKLYKDWGVNSVRFHTWCPPEAAFIAADEVGLYLQVEDNDWSRFKTAKQDSFAREESLLIFRKYGNHPCFTMLSLGNELTADSALLYNLIEFWKKTDNRHLYCGKVAGSPFLKNFQFWNAGQIKNVPTRYHGVPGGGWPPHGMSTFFHTEAPTTDRDWNAALKLVDMPYITHELGQRCSYPDVINDPFMYTGSLKPAYLDIARDQLKERGMFEQVPDFVKSSGQWQVELYKEEIEANLRTTDMAGFNLLTLQDFPGQGTAPVGLMNVFYKSKGYVEATRFSRFCAPTVLLTRMKKRIFENDETFSANIEMYNFPANPLVVEKFVCMVKDPLGNVVYSKEFPGGTFPIGRNLKIGSISFDLQHLNTPSRYNLTLSIPGTKIENDWNFWVYPKKTEVVDTKSVITAHEFNTEVRKALDKGETVLLLPGLDSIKGKLPVCFADFYWTAFDLIGGESSVAGMLCNPAHPVFNYFPTSYYTDWNWWDLFTKARPMILDEFGEQHPFPKNYRPVIQMIDSWKVNRKMAILLEGKLGKGKIMICSIDLEKDVEKRPATRQFRYSLLKYLGSPEFNPSVTLTEEMIQDLFISKKAGNEKKR